MKILLLLVALLSSSLLYTHAHAEAGCEEESRITHDFDNGARWDLCWESRIRENLVLSDVHYSPPDEDAIRVLGSARLSQLHVAYDDSDVTYNDVTQYGLGGSYLLTLTEADCPTGQLLDVQTRPAVCLWQTSDNKGYLTPTRAARSASINLFSVSQVGAYAYIISWAFYDDGSFEPGVGATGALQRSSDDTSLPFGRVLQGDADTLWLSHTHNYYWRLDFDIGDSATDDTVYELAYSVDPQGRREQSREQFITEQARRIHPDTQQLWRVMDNDGNSAAGYQIEPTRKGHRFERKEIEPYTEFDFFVTVGNDCERFASQNARFNPDCLNHVLQFVDGQSVVSEDIVLWNRVSFHHTPRSEDQRNMHTHWDGFMIEPVNLLGGTSALLGMANKAPAFSQLPDRQSALGELVHDDMIQAMDEDGDILSYSATGLPPGLGIRPNGHIHGYPLAEGRYSVRVAAYDDHSEATSSFQWTVGDASLSSGRSSGALSIWLLLMLVTTVVMRFHQARKCIG